MKQMLGVATIAYGMLTLSGLLVTSWLQRDGMATADALIAMAAAYVSSVCAHTAIDDGDRQIADRVWLIVLANMFMVMSVIAAVLAFLNLVES